MGDTNTESILFDYKETKEQLITLLESHLDMHNELVQCAKDSKIKMEEVLKVITIQNWISHYTREHRQKAATKKVN
ncbi:16733_t:CDS:2 [Gigaspora margarita]|uniref:16733_t:CDS:1 n=1 Tax=Gigaspora margarita TaxID=4874 RepID=A0ABN7V0L0_GIGMA|nr:16733_t:CDS:2 [Gigaspora margarita]